MSNVLFEKQVTHAQYISCESAAESKRDRRCLALKCNLFSLYLSLDGVERG